MAGLLQRPLKDRVVDRNGGATLDPATRSNRAAGVTQ
jgi:hypothetical protein